jgi:proline dehydrogenase
MALAISLALSLGAFVAPVLAITCPDNGNLTGGSVSPASGTTATNFTFSVTYQDNLGETPDSILESLVKRLGLPAVRAATRQAMRLLGSHFVLGQTIEEALDRAVDNGGSRYSFDMLGEGARTAADAERYLAAYAAAIDAIGKAAGDDALPNRPGISVKLSALHPRYEAVSRGRVLAEIVPRVLALAQKARDHDLNFTIDVTGWCSAKA